MHILGLNQNLLVENRLLLWKAALLGYPWLCPGDALADHLCPALYTGRCGVGAPAQHLQQVPQARPEWGGAAAVKHLQQVRQAIPEGGGAAAVHQEVQGGVHRQHQVAQAAEM